MGLWPRWLCFWMDAIPRHTVVGYMKPASIIETAISTLTYAALHRSCMYASLMGRISGWCQSLPAMCSLQQSLVWTHRQSSYQVGIALRFTAVQSRALTEGSRGDEHDRRQIARPKKSCQETRTSHAAHARGIQHQFVNHSMLETCSAGAGGIFCREVGDVVACVVLSSMNDLWPCGFFRKLAVTMSLGQMLPRTPVGSARGITQTARCTGDSTVNTTVPTVSNCEPCTPEKGVQSELFLGGSEGEETARA